MKKIIAVCLLISSLLLSAVSCNGSVQGTDTLSKTYYNYFDTVSTVSSYAADREFDKRAEQVRQILEKYHILFDIYNSYDGVNNLKTVNDRAGEWVEVSEELIDFLDYAIDMHRLTEGEMNIAIGAVTSLWHNARKDGGYIPSVGDLKIASFHTDIECIEIDRESSKVRLADSLMRLDVGAVGKGYAAEMARRHLTEAGADSYVLNIGGNLCVIGEKPNGEGWRTGIKNPEVGIDPYYMKISLKNTSCVTSGNYERFYTVDGKRYHHIIDKDTLMPADYFISVTVLCSDSAKADSLSTALFCMPLSDGMALINSISDAEAMWVSVDGVISYTDGFGNTIIH